MEKIDDYKVIIITEEDEKNNLKDGTVIFKGKMIDNKLHSEIVKKYCEHTYGKGIINNDTSLAQMSEILTKYGNILLYNLSGEDGPKFGIIYVSNTITDKQKESLNRLLDNLVDFELELEYEINGEYDTCEGSYDENFEEIRDFIESITQKTKRK